jgi:hypothetical protein
MEEKISAVQANGKEWYTAAIAAEVMSRNNHRTVKPEYLRSLARLKKIETMQLGARATLYLKSDVDAYAVEDRGTKAAIAMKSRAGQIQKASA